MKSGLLALTGSIGSTSSTDSFRPFRSVSAICIGWVLPPLCNSWIVFRIWLYIALKKTPNTDCDSVRAVPNTEV